MKTYILTSPEGKKYRVTGNGTGEEALAELQAKLGGSQTNEPEKQDAFSTVTDQALQGATFGLGNRAQAGLAALALTAMNDKTLSENYKQAREVKQEQMQQQVEDNPALAIGANVAGALATGGLGATTKAGAALGNSLRGGAILGKELGTTGRIIKGAAAGSAFGAASGAGTAGYNQSLSGAGEGAIFGAVAGGAIPAVGAMGKKLIGAFKESNPLLNSEQVKSLASQAYNNATQSGGVLTSQFTNKFVDELNSVLPQTQAGKLVAGESKLSEIVNRMKGLRNRNITLQEAQEIDEFLGDTIDNFVDAGRLTKEGVRLKSIQDTFRNMVDSATPDMVIGGKAGFDALKDGRFFWSQSAKMRDIEKIITRAEMMENPATGLKTGFRTLYNNPNRIKSFTPDERELIRKAADTGVTTEILRTLGSRLMPIGTAVSTASLPASIAAQGMSMAARGGAAKLQANRAFDVSNQIANKVAQRAGIQVPVAQSAELAPLAIPAGAATGAIVAPQSIPVQQNVYKPSKPVEFNRPQSNNQFFDRVKQAESSGNPNAQAQTSSASGLYQFTDQTWRDSVAKWGMKYGITEDMKNNPQAQEVMVRELAADNARILTKKLGREPSVADMYVAHFLGATYAPKLIDSLGTGKLALSVLPPDFIRANEPIFFDKNKRPRTVEQVYALLGDKVS